MCRAGFAFRRAASAAAAGLLSFAVLLVAGCVRTAGVSTMCDVRPSGWSETAQVVYDNADTVNLYTLSVAVRHNGVEGGGLHAELLFAAPDSSLFAEKIFLPLSSRSRTAAAAAVETVPYRRAVRLGQQGRYTIYITPEGEARGIEAVGLVFDKE